MTYIQKNQLLQKVEIFAKKNSLDDDIHGFEHVKRVYNLCLKIGKECDANLYILKIAAFLHDIGRLRVREDGLKQNHAEVSAQMALKFLKKFEKELGKETIERILHAIRAHSFSNNIPPETLEAKVLSDADKLDALGAIGLYRTIGFTVKHRGNLRDVIDHLEKKILNLREQMNLTTSKQVANERHKILYDFYTRIKKE